MHSLTFPWEKLWQVVEKTPLQVRQICHYQKRDVIIPLSSPPTKSQAKLSAQAVLWMQLLGMKTLLPIASWSSSPDFQLGYKPSPSSLSLRVFRCRPHSQEGTRRWPWSAGRNTGKPRPLQKCYPLPAATPAEINTVTMPTISTVLFSLWIG